MNLSDGLWPVWLSVLWMRTNRFTLGEIWWEGSLPITHSDALIHTFLKYVIFFPNFVCIQMRERWRSNWRESIHAVNKIICEEWFSTNSNGQHLSASSTSESMFYETHSTFMLFTTFFSPSHKIFHTYIRLNKQNKWLCAWWRWPRWIMKRIRIFIGNGQNPQANIRHQQWLLLSM